MVENDNVSAKIPQNIMCVKKCAFGILENDIIDDSVIMNDEITEATKSIPTKTITIKNVIIHLPF